jgi:protein involved in polysaccharide export with SLBB domain
VVSTGATDPFFHTYGERVPGSVLVLVYGYSVRQPGYYFLPPGATIRDAISAAKGLDDKVDWRKYCAITRLKSDGSKERTKLTSRGEAEGIPLREGDKLWFAHEVY